MYLLTSVSVATRLPAHLTACLPSPLSVSVPGSQAPSAFPHLVSLPPLRSGPCPIHVSLPLMSPEAVLSHDTQAYPLASARMETTLPMLPGNYSLTVTSQGLHASITVRSGGSYEPAPHLQNMCPCLQQ